MGYTIDRTKHTLIYLFTSNVVDQVMSYLPISNLRFLPGEPDCIRSNFLDIKVLNFSGSWKIHLSLVLRKPVFGVCGLVRLILVSLAVETSYRLEISNKETRYYTIQAVNNKDADQTARMCRLICIFVVRIWHKQVFSWLGSFNIGNVTNLLDVSVLVYIQLKSMYTCMFLLGKDHFFKLLVGSPSILREIKMQSVL